MSRQTPASSRRDRPRHPDGQPSVFTCPDCSGTLFVTRDGGLVRFRCRIGHVYSPEAMLEAQDDNVERLMWSTVRALEEQAEYLERMTEEIAKADDPSMRKWYDGKNRTALHCAEIVRQLITRGTDEEHPPRPRGKSSKSHTQEGARRGTAR